MRRGIQAGAGVAGVGLTLITAAAGVLGAPKGVWIAMLVVGVLCMVAAACLFARDRAGQRSASPVRRRRLKNEVGHAIQEGHRLLEAGIRPPEFWAWNTRTSDLIALALGPAEAHLFGSEAGYEFHGDDRDEVAVRHHHLRCRLRRLEELVPRLDAVELLPSYDPSR